MIDPSIKILINCNEYKTDSFQSGEMIGGSMKGQKRTFTAICKSDCIILEMDQDVFTIVNS